MTWSDAHTETVEEDEIVYLLFLVDGIQLYKCEHFKNTYKNSIYAVCH